MVRSVRRRRTQTVRTSTGRRVFVEKAAEVTLEGGGIFFTQPLLILSLSLRAPLYIGNSSKPMVPHCKPCKPFRSQPQMDPGRRRGCEEFPILLQKTS